MTPNAHNAASEPVFSGEHRSTVRASAARWKTGAAPSVLPLPQPVSDVPKVSLHGISLSYKTTNGTRLLAIDNIDLKVRAGEFLCIVGPSGCGRSTLLHLIAGLHKPTSGHAQRTRDLLHDDLERRSAETARTIVLLTNDLREAVRFGDRVVLFTFRPGRVKHEFKVDLPRPRQLEEVDVARAAREILEHLREEINKSLEVEYGVWP